MVNTVEQYKAHLNPTKTNNFELAVLPPVFLVGDPAFSLFKWHVRTAPLQGDDLDEIDIPFAGTSVYIAGDKSYSSFSTTVLNNKKYDIRKLLLRWREYIKSDPTGTSADDLLYKSIAYLYQKNGAGGIAYTQAMVGFWPKTVGDLTNSMDDKSSIQTFDVTWRYDYLLPEII